MDRRRVAELVHLATGDQFSRTVFIGEGFFLPLFALLTLLQFLVCWPIVRLVNGMPESQVHSDVLHGELSAIKH